MNRIPSWTRNLIIVLLIAGLLCFMAINPLKLSAVSVLTGQEFFFSHSNDIIRYFTENYDTADDYYLATGQYEASLSKADPAFYGIAEGKNLIVVQMESFQGMVVGQYYNGQEITPCLNRLIDSEPGSVYFDNYYHQIGSGNTSDAEFAANNSIIGSYESYTYNLFPENYFYGLPWLLKEQGYSTQVYHGFADRSFWNREKAYPTLGFDSFYSGGDYVSDQISGIGGGNIEGISDSAFFSQTADMLAQQQAPFYSFLITLSTHNPFQLPAELSDIDLLPADENTLFGNYINSVHYSDRCIGEFIQELKDNGLWENSVVVFYGDHFALTKADDQISDSVSAWLGRPYNYQDLFRIPMILHIPGYEGNLTMSNSGGSLDTMPTLAYLLGLKSLDTIYLGNNMFTGEDNTVAFQMHLVKGSFIKEHILYEASRDGIFEHGTITDLLTGEPADSEGHYEDYRNAQMQIDLSNFYLYNDILRYAVSENLTMEEIQSAISKQERLSSNLDVYYLPSGDREALSQWVSAMVRDPEHEVLLLSDDILTVLSDFSASYSGIAGEAGTIHIENEALNKVYKSIVNRTIPLLYGTQDSVKLSYLPYKQFMVMPDQDTATEDMIRYIRDNAPAGIVVPADQVMRYCLGQGLRGIPVYAFGTNTGFSKLLAKQMGASGYANGDVAAYLADILHR